jgi:hypothetical protein
MSYDLYFCALEPRTLRFQDVAGWALKYEHFSRRSETELFYSNENTGVYFSIDAVSSDDAGELDLPRNVFPVAFTFNLNYARPTFFAVEAMAVVESLARSFDLVIYDPQADGEARLRTGAELLESWARGNANAVDYLANEACSLNYLPRARADSFWNYMTSHPSLRNDLASDDVFVPRQVLVAPENSNQAGTGP